LARGEVVARHLTLRDVAEIVEALDAGADARRYVCAQCAFQAGDPRDIRASATRYPVSTSCHGHPRRKMIGISKTLR
jgi:hypothetical protein